MANIELTLPGKSGSSSSKGSSGVGGFVGNLANDVGTALTGIPMGLVQTAEHPIRSVENMGKATWHDWSPLFHGNISKFGHQFYDHPLAPLLDVATVFSGGAALGGKIAGELSKAGVDNALVNALKSGAHTHILEDPVQPLAGHTARASQAFETSANPLKRGVQNAMFHAAGKYGDHLPKWFTPAGKFERLHITRSMDRNTATIRVNKDAANAYNAQLAAIQQGGKALVQNEAQLTPMILHRIYDGAFTHATPFDDFLRHGNGKKIFDNGGMTPVYKPLPRGLKYLHIDSADFRTKLAHDPSQTIEDRLINLGHTLTTNDPLKAARDSSGKALLLQSRSLHDLGIEGAKSSIFMKAWYRYPTRVWKMALVGMSPKMVVDNAVGNWAMYAMKQGGHHAARGIFDAIRQTRGLKVAKDSLNETTKQFLSPHWMEQHFAPELGQSFFGSALKDNIAKLDKNGVAIPEKKGFIHEGFYPAVHRIADQPVRRAAINGFMRSAPEVKKFMDKGASYDKAVSSALKADKSGALQRRAVEHSRSIGGDYHTISDSGRMVKDLVPFYMWDRHILRHFGNVLTESPGRVAALQAVSHQGVAKTQAMMGAIPSFLDGSIPVGKQSNGRERTIATQGISPYSTIADLASAFSAATTGGQKTSPGESIGGMANPVLTNLYEAISGHRVGTDATVKSHGGVIPTAAINMAEGLPQFKLLQRLASNPGGNSNAPTKTASGHTKNPTLDANSLTELLSNFMGVPIKDISPQNAAKLSRTETHKKLPKHGSLQLTLP